MLLVLKMSKFGASRENSDSKTTRVQQQQPWNEHIEKYVHENALCLNATKEFDAKSRRIQHVAEPEEDGDVATKQFVEEHVAHVTGNLGDDFVNRAYVRDNALCLTNNGYDARGITIRHVPWPRALNDVAHKNYVDESIKNEHILMHKRDGERRQYVDAQLDSIKLLIKENDTETKKYIDDNVKSVKRLLDDLDRKTLQRINALHQNIDTLFDWIHKIEGERKQ